MENVAFGLNDRAALLSGIQAKEVVEMLTLDDVERFLESLGVDVDRFENHLICPTICHNAVGEATSRKLYWYHDHKVFHCYTECNESMSIFELYQRYMEINEHKIGFREAQDYIEQFISNVYVPERKKTSPLTLDRDKYIIGNTIQELPEYSSSVLDCFLPYYHPLWLGEGISKESMKKFGIRFSVGQNKIIIPHYDLLGRLVGVRGRALEEEDIALGKYRPISIGETTYAHQLQFNLYGLYQHQDAIRKCHRVIIYEGEKSVLLDDTYYGKDSIGVACCGSNLNKYQVAILTKELEVNEIVIAFDKEYEKLYSPKAKQYKKKLADMCDKYKHLAALSYIYDERNLLEMKDAPVDKGQETFEKLYKERIQVRW